METELHHQDKNQVQNQDKKQASKKVLNFNKGNPPRTKQEKKKNTKKNFVSWDTVGVANSCWNISFPYGSDQRNCNAPLLVVIHLIKAHVNDIKSNCGIDWILKFASFYDETNWRLLSMGIP